MSTSFNVPHDKMYISAYQLYTVGSYVVTSVPQVPLQFPCVFSSGATTSSKLGVQFLGLGYYYPSTEKKLDRSTQFGAFGYIITLYS